VDSLDKEFTPRAGLETIINLCTHGADDRYLTADKKPKEVAAGWSALYSLIEWAIDGTKAVRPFSGWNGGHVTTGKHNSKDSLNGKEEAVLRVGNRDQELSATLEQLLEQGQLMKSGEDLGATSLVKRLWPYTWLCTRHTFEPSDFQMPNTRSIAAHEPWAHSGDDDPPDSAGEKYFAVLALDGDNMGKWISGSKTPKLKDVLSSEAAKVYLEAGANLENPRPLSPSWHLQFAEALGNFAQHAARRVVEAFDGRLIYAGGDDVLALLPADTALECAHALRLAFQGDPKVNTAANGVLIGKGHQMKSDRSTALFNIQHPGFLQLTPAATKRHGAGAGLLDDPVKFPVIVPGPSTDCSVGIAIAHFKSPLQDVVRAAQKAEKRAKNQPDKAAVAVSLFKRSGEIIEWGCQWQSGGLDLYEAIAKCLDEKTLSSKFPYRVCQLLEPYLSSRTGIGRQSDAADFAASEIIRREFAFAAERQGSKAIALALAAPLDHHMSRIAAAFSAQEQKHKKENKESSKITLNQTLLIALIGLCTTVAFAHRTKANDTTNKPKGS
jgi:hypothetical protein